MRELAGKANTPASQDAYVFATVELARILLQNDEVEEAQKKLNDCEKTLDSFDAVETVVHAAFYKANAEYYKVCFWGRLKGKLLTFFRPKTILPLTIRMPFFILLVLSSMIYRIANVNRAHTICQSQH